MVVRHFRVVEHLLRLRQSSPVQRSSQRLIIAQPLQYAGTFGIDVVTQESGIYTRIGRYFLFVKRLDGFQRLIGGESEFPVALHLQGSQVEQTGRSLFPVLTGDVRYGKRENSLSVPANASPRSRSVIGSIPRLSSGLAALAAAPSFCFLPLPAPVPHRSCGEWRRRWCRDTPSSVPSIAWERSSVFRAVGLR